MSKIHKPWITHEELDAYIGGGIVDVLDHAATHEVGGGDLLAFASITDFGTYLDQAVKQASAVSFTGITDTATTATNLAAGTTGQRPGGVVGDIRYNSTLARYEIYPGVWKSIPHVGDAPTAHAASHEKGGGDLISTLADLTVDNLNLGTVGNLTFDSNVSIISAADAIAFQNSQANERTILRVMPKGVIAPTPATLEFFGTDFIADAVNYERLRIYAGTTYEISTHKGGTGTLRPLCLFTDGNANQLYLAIDGKVGIGKVPTEKLDVDGIVKATTFEGNLHWDYITNEPTYYPPEYHIHVGKDIVSLHLVDLDYDPDVHGEDADIFDVMATAAIHGQGNYDWWGTWATVAAANTSAEITVLAGDDKMLTLTDNNGGDFVTTVLAVDAPHYMVTGVIEFRIREDDWGTVGVGLTKGGARNMEFLMIDDGIGARKFWFFNGTVEVDLATAYALDTWYTVRIHFDCVARAAVIFINNTFVKRTTLNAAAVCDYVDAIRFQTNELDTGYVVDINNLKVFNLTI